MIDIKSIDLIITEVETFCGKFQTSGGIDITYQPKDYDYSITFRLPLEVSELILLSCKKEAIEHFATVKETNL